MPSFLEYLGIPDYFGFSGPRTRKYLQGLECQVLCWECVRAVCVCEMFVWLPVHVSTNFYGGCVRCVRWNNVRLVTNDFCLHNTVPAVAHHHGAGTREENTWSTTEGEKQPSGGVRLRDCLSSGCKQGMQSVLRGWWLFGADEGEDKESPERFRGGVY